MQNTGDSESKHRALFDNNLDAVLLTNVDGRVLAANPAACAMFGMSEEEICRRGRAGLIDPADTRQSAQEEERRRTGRVRGQLNFVRRDGSRFPGEYSSVVLDAQGSAFVIIREITETRQAGEELLKFTEKLEQEVAARTADLLTLHQTLLKQSRTLDAYFQHALTPLVFLDRHFNFLRVNEAYARACRKNVEDFPGHNHFEFFPSEAQAIFEEVVRTRKPAQVFAYPFMFPDHPEWGVSYWNWTLTPLLDDREEVEVLVFALQDVTEHALAEQALRNLNTALEQRAKQLQALALQLTEAEERERRRIADLLHDDLQQLLSASRFRLSVIRPVVQGQPTAELMLHEVDQLLSESIEKSRRLSHDLSPAILRHSGLPAALEWLVKRKKERYGLTVETDVRDWKQFNSEALGIFFYRAIQELLFNVVKHSGVSRARLELRQREGRAEAIVTDQGRGFDPRTLDRVGHPVQGLGLLSIRERMQYLGGDLEIESAPGAGSRFTLWVPLHDHAQPKRKATVSSGPKAPAPVGKPRAGDEVLFRVLLVDDHQVMRQGLSSMLESHPGIQVIGEASNGREAVHLTRDLNPDVVVMDVVMPEMDGIEATEIIKTEMPHVRVVGLTMLSDGDVSDRLRRAGADAYVNKGGAAEELIEAIRGSKWQREEKLPARRD